MEETASTRTAVEPRLLEPLELAAWRGMLRTNALIERALEADLVRDHGLQTTAYEVLMFLADAEDGRLRLSDLATLAVLSRSGLTRLVDRLEREGRVRRERCSDDARGYFACITPEGREQVMAARVDYLDGVRAQFLELLTEDEQVQLGAIWTRVLDRLEPGLRP